jgi:hypothetical protein
LFFFAVFAKTFAPLREKTIARKGAKRKRKGREDEI